MSACAASGSDALLGEAQHDEAVAALLATTDVIGDSARRALASSLPSLDDAAIALPVGPILYDTMIGRPVAVPSDPEHVEHVLRALGLPGGD